MWSLVNIKHCLFNFWCNTRSLLHSTHYNPATIQHCKSSVCISFVVSATRSEEHKGLPHMWVLHARKNPDFPEFLLPCRAYMHAGNLSISVSPLKQWRTQRQLGRVMWSMHIHCIKLQNTWTSAWISLIKESWQNFCIRDRKRKKNVLSCRWLLHMCAHDEHIIYN